MKHGSIGQIILSLTLGAVLGVGGLKWLEHSIPPVEDEHAASPAGHEAEDEHGHHEGSDSHESEDGAIVLTEEAIRDHHIEVASTGGGLLEQTLTLPGAIALNADKVAHIVPRVAGIVQQVNKNLGANVQAGEIMVVLESRELAEMKAGYLAAQERCKLAQANLRSAQELHDKKILPDLEFLAIQKAAAETDIEFKMMENKLAALGVSLEQLQSTASHGTSLTIYELRAPFAGTIVEKHCTLGEILNDDSTAFILADLSTVWANITVYPQESARVRVGQSVELRADGLGHVATGTVFYLSPVTDEATRTLCARVELPNADGRWRPGTFVTATLATGSEQVAVLVPSEALQRIKGEPTVFILDDHGFEPRVVSVGRTSRTQVEITDGLAPGERYVTQGAVLLKAELGKRQAVHVH